MAATPPLTEAIMAGAHAANVVHATTERGTGGEGYHLGLARQLAASAADAYRAAGSPLGELQALAVQLAAGGALDSPAAALQDLQEGLGMAEAAIGRVTQLAVLVGRAHVRLAAPEELAALRQVERLFGLSGLAERHEQPPAAGPAPAAAAVRQSRALTTILACPRWQRCGWPQSVCMAPMRGCRSACASRRRSAAWAAQRRWTWRQQMQARCSGRQPSICTSLPPPPQLPSWRASLPASQPAAASRAWQPPRPA